jgi:hypothetical protein
MKKQKIDWKITCSGIAGIVILESIALLTGHNGTWFALSLCIIAGAIGLTTPTPKIFQK